MSDEGEERFHRDFRIETTGTGRAVVVEVRGDLDAATAPKLADHLAWVAADPSGRHVVVDLCGLTVMDSSGLKALIEGQAPLVEQGRRLVLACLPDGAPRALFEIGRIDEFFTIFASADEALRHLERPPRG